MGVYVPGMSLDVVICYPMFLVGAYRSICVVQRCIYAHWRDSPTNVLLV